MDYRPFMSSKQSDSLSTLKQQISRVNYIPLFSTIILAILTSISFVTYQEVATMMLPSLS